MRYPYRHDFPHCPGMDQMNPRAGWLQWRDWNLGDRGRPGFGSQKVSSWPESYGLRPQGTSSWRGVELNFSSFLVDFLFPETDGYTPEDQHRIWKWWFGRWFSFTNGCFRDLRLSFLWTMSREDAFTKSPLDWRIEVSFDDDADQMEVEPEGPCQLFPMDGWGSS